MGTYISDVVDLRRRTTTTKKEKKRGEELLEIDE